MHLDLTKAPDGYYITLTGLKPQSYFYPDLEAAWADRSLYRVRGGAGNAVGAGGRGCPGAGQGIGAGKEGTVKINMLVIRPATCQRQIGGFR